MRTIKIFILCLFAAVSGKCEPSEIVKNISNDIIHQLEELMNHNARNNSIGKSNENKYLLNYIPGMPFTIDNCEPSYIIDKIPNANINEAWGNLSEQLCQYNNNNIFSIKHYGIAIWYPDNTSDTELYQLMTSFAGINDNSNIVTYTKSQVDAFDRIAFKAIYNEIEQHIKDHINIPEVANNSQLLVTMMSIFSLRDYQQNHSYDIRTKTFYAASPFMEQNFIDYLEYAKNGVFDTDGLDLDFYYGDFFRRLYGFVDFFDNFYDLPNGTPCTSIPTYINTSINTFVDQKCGLPLNEKEIEFLYVLSEFLEQYLNLVPLPEYTSSVMDWANSIFNTYDGLMNQDKWSIFLLDKILTDGSVDSYLNARLYFSGTTFVDHNKLTSNDRFEVLKKLSDYPVNVYLQNGDYAIELIDIVNEFLFSSVENNYFDALNFFILLKNDTGVFDFLWAKILNSTFGSADKKMAIIKSITKLSMLTYSPPTKVQDFNEAFQDDTYIWKLNPWWTNIHDHHTYENAGYDPTVSSDFPSGKTFFDHKYLESVTTTITGTQNGAIVSSEEVYNSDQLKTYDPFKLLCVKSGKDIKWNTYCPTLLSDGDCIFTPKVLPAFAVVWYISNMQSEITMDKFGDIAGGVSVVVSFGAFLAATSVSAIIVNGIVLVLDIVAVTAPTLQAYTLFALFPGDLNANAINSSVEETQQLADITGLAAGLLDFGFMLKGLASYKRLVRVGALNNVPAYDKAFEGMRLMSSIDETDPTKIADLLELGPVARSYIASTSATDEIKLMLLGLIESKPFLKNVTQDKVFTLLRRAMEIQDIDKHIFSLNDDQLLRFLDEFGSSSADVSKIVDNPNIISVWRIADEVVPNRPRCFDF